MPRDHEPMLMCPMCGEPALAALGHKSDCHIGPEGPPPWPPWLERLPPAPEEPRR
jgi:hypothetical protein